MYPNSVSSYLGKLQENKVSRNINNPKISGITCLLMTMESSRALPRHSAMPFHKTPSWAVSTEDWVMLSSGEKSLWGVKGGIIHPWNGASSDRQLSPKAVESERGDRSPRKQWTSYMEDGWLEPKYTVWTLSSHLWWNPAHILHEAPHLYQTH